MVLLVIYLTVVINSGLCLDYFKHLFQHIICLRNSVSSVWSFQFIYVYTNCFIIQILTTLCNSKRLKLMSQNFAHLTQCKTLCQCFKKKSSFLFDNIKCTDHSRLVRLWIFFVKSLTINGWKNYIFVISRDRKK